MKEKEIIQKIDKAISDLVYEKKALIKAYNYYHGVRDPDQFQHLETNYGIGTPTSVEFVPLVKKHIDILIGEYLSAPVTPRISCKDSATLSAIHRDKQIKINNEVVKVLKGLLENELYSETTGEKKPDGEILRQLKTLVEYIDSNFISEYEIAAQNIVDWAIQSRDIDYVNKRKTLLLDLLIAGVAYYKVYKTKGKSGIDLRILNPLNTFIDRNEESPYLKDSHRSVIREYLTKDQIMIRYGEYLKKSDIDSLTESGFSDGEYAKLVKVGDNDPGILGGYEVTTSNNSKNNFYNTHPVYEVEFLKSEKHKSGEYYMYRYSGVRIGSSIYIVHGKDEESPRSMDFPNQCHLTVNGLFNLDRNGDPFSLILATADLQDKYDVLNFYKDNVIASSGTVGDWIDIAFVPKEFGLNLQDRLLKWQAYKKQGLAVINSSQEGNALNTTFNGFDDTLKLQAVQSIEVAIQSVENTCSTITGVFRERLGNIEARDAVTNVAVGTKNSFLITKQYYQIMDLLTRESLLDILNMAKVVFKNGIKGTLVLGDKLNKIFTALPEHYSITDYDVHIIDSSEVINEQETIKQLAIEFTKGQLIDPEVIIEMYTSKGLTAMREKVLQSIRTKKEENNQLGQLQQQLEQTTKQLEQVSKEAEQLKKQKDALEQAKLELEKAKLEHKKEIEWFEAKIDKTHKEDKIKWEKERVKLEGLQLFDLTPKNDEIKNK